MPAPFARLQARVNSAVERCLSDVMVSIGGAPDTPALFDSAYAQASVGGYGMAGTSPALTLQTTAVPATPEGVPVTVDGVAYTIALHQPDGTGMSVLLLEKA